MNAIDQAIQLIKPGLFHCCTLPGLPEEEGKINYSLIPRHKLKDALQSLEKAQNEMAQLKTIAEYWHDKAIELGWLK